MPHSVPLITTIAAALGLALVLGFLAMSLRAAGPGRLPDRRRDPGPATPGFVADVELSAQLAEIGGMLLMFGVGLRFSLDDLRRTCWSASRPRPGSGPAETSSGGGPAIAGESGREEEPCST